MGGGGYFQYLLMIIKCKTFSIARKVCLIYILQNLLKCWFESVGGVLTALWRSLNVLLIRVPLQRAGVEVPRWKYSNYASRSSGGGGEDWPDLQNQIRGIENVVGRKRRASNWGEVKFLDSSGRRNVDESNASRHSSQNVSTQTSRVCNNKAFNDISTQRRDKLT